MPLREPLDAAGNRVSEAWAQQAQVRDLRRTRPCDHGFPSDAGVAALARFASAARFWPVCSQQRDEVGSEMSDCGTFGQESLLTITCERPDSSDRRNILR